MMHVQFVLSLQQYIPRKCSTNEIWVEMRKYHPVAGLYLSNNYGRANSEFRQPKNGSCASTYEDPGKYNLILEVRKFQKSMEAFLSPWNSGAENISKSTYYIREHDIVEKRYRFRYCKQIKRCGGINILFPMH